MLFTKPISKKFKYTMNDINGHSFDPKKPVVVIVGGERIPIQHVFVVGKGNAEEEGFEEKDYGALVIDLDV